MSYLAFGLGKTLTGQVVRSLPEVLKIAATGYTLKFIIAIAITPLIYLGRGCSTARLVSDSAPPAPDHLMGPPHSYVTPASRVWPNDLELLSCAMIGTFLVTQLAPGHRTGRPRSRSVAQEYQHFPGSQEVLFRASVHRRQ